MDWKNYPVSVGHWAVLRSPFVPDLLGVDFTPELDGDGLVGFDVQRTDAERHREEHRIPAGHARRVRGRENADLNVFVKLRGEVAGEAVQHAVHLCTEGELLVSRVVDWIAQVRVLELEKCFWFVNVINAVVIAQPVDFARTLLKLFSKLVVTQRAVDLGIHGWANVGDGVARNADAVGLEKRLRAVQALRTELVVSERPQQLAYDYICLLFENNGSHVFGDQFDVFFRPKHRDESCQSDDGVGILLNHEDFQFSPGVFRCIQRSTNQRSTASSQHHENQSLSLLSGVWNFVDQSCLNRFLVQPVFDWIALEHLKVQSYQLFTSFS